MIATYARTWALDDISIRRSGDGRTVEAYAAIFDTPAEIHDQHGHYIEQIDRAAFNRTARSGRAVCLYNHGMSLDGVPVMLGQVPLGTAQEIRPDGRGLFTVTRYNKSALADSVLEAIRAGDIKGQSFRGRILRSSPMRVPRVKPGGVLPTVVRQEMGLDDYGPTPNPYYEGAVITAVRSRAQLATDFAALDAADRAQLLQEAGLDEAARMELLRALSSSTPPAAGPEAATATPDGSGPGAEDPHETLVHSGRQSDITRRIRAGRILRGM